MEKRKPLRDSINSLLVFHEVVRHRSFSKAAEKLFISQPAVTKHIKGLEHKVGTRLVERGRGGFHLSEAGKILFKSAQKISNHLREVEHHLGRLQKEHHGLLRIGTTESYSRCLMPELLSGFQNLFPSIKIALDVGNSEEIEKSLTAYRNDLALIGMTKVPHKFESIPFLKEELVLIVSPSDPMAKRGKVSLKTIRKFPFIIRAKGSTTRKIILKAFQELGIRPSLLIEAGSSEFIKQWVSEGKGISIIVRRIAEEEARRGLIKMVSLDEKLYLQVVLLFLKEERANPVIKTFTHFIEDSRKEWIA
ncbi:MAG: LysR family transcriptional regulator [Desulfobacterales bacterium]|jgi:DNA-binding transcriptional LysR family regulator|nr:LysR family transcriptional regulator [Desulfobacterales bacterium]